jgi:hypothetical protein
MHTYIASGNTPVAQPSARLCTGAPVAQRDGSREGLTLNTARVTQTARDRPSRLIPTPKPRPCHTVEPCGLRARQRRDRGPRHSPLDYAPGGLRHSPAARLAPMPAAATSRSRAQGPPAARLCPPRQSAAQRLDFASKVRQRLAYARRRNVSISRPRSASGLPMPAAARRNASISRPRSASGSPMPAAPVGGVQGSRPHHADPARHRQNRSHVNDHPRRRAVLYYRVTPHNSRPRKQRASRIEVFAQVFTPSRQ